jgi:putative SOS response-associated peptidase YedK
MTWGLVPHWSKHQDKSLNTINARSENLVDGGGMWTSVKKNRCAVLCQGYYEWLKKGRDRWPYFTKRQDGKLMLLAGLYDCVTLQGEAEPLWTFTIVTTAANNEFEWLHDRQPVILSSTEALDTWLDPSSEAWSTQLTKLVEPYRDPATPLQCYSVPKEVGKVGTESSTFIEPISKRKDGIQAMFSKQKQKQDSPEKSKSGKRKRSSSASPVIDLSLETESKLPSKRVKSGGDPWGKDIICLDGPSSSQEALPSKFKASSPDKTKSKTLKSTNPATKITTFFSKA